MWESRALLAACAVTGALASSLVSANCGSAFCAVNTDWNVQGVYVEPGARAELRYEYVNQDQLRSGARKVAPGEVDSDHEELSTLNQALFATFDYNFASGWGVSAIVPVVSRDHEHIHDPQGAATFEEWQFTNLGDIRLGGRYQFQIGAAGPDRPQTLGLLFGVKLPTGATDVSNSEGETAERSLQPGTGTTDPLLGAYYQVRLPRYGVMLFVQGGYAWPLNSHDGYKPGDRFTFDVGVNYAATEKLGLLLQLNALWRGKDSGLEAEPEDSGGQYVYLSPGISFMATRNVQLFALLQLPVYQYVNGVQLTADWGATAGVGIRF